MAFSLFSKPANKPKVLTPAKSAVDVRPANDSRRGESDAAKNVAPRDSKLKRSAPPAASPNNSTLLLGVGKDWRPAYSKIEVDETRTMLCPALENAALLFANGQTEIARQTLAEAVVTDREAQASMLAWLALFDLLQRLGDKAAVDELALKFVVAFERSPPVWDERRHASGAEVPDAKAKGSQFVRFSGDLERDNPGLLSFVKAADSAPKCRVDFSGLTAADEDACHVLADLLRTLRRKSYPLQVQGAEALQCVLQARVVVGQRSGEGYWALLLELLQWMKDGTEFEEQAVNYAISFELSPPSWEGLTGEQAQQQSAVATEAAAAPHETDAYLLQGVLTGTGEPQVLRIREFAKDNNSIVLDFSGVERIDFVCAGSLLNELEGVERVGKPIQIVGASPIVQALLLVIGIKPRYFQPRLQ